MHGHIRLRPTFSPLFTAIFHNDRLLDPTVKVRRDLAYEQLPLRLETIEKSTVAAIEFVERPRGYANSVGTCVFDLLQRDLWFRAKFDFLGHIVFFRRAASLA